MSACFEKTFLELAIPSIAARDFTSDIAIYNLVSGVSFFFLRMGI